MTDCRVLFVRRLAGLSALAGCSPEYGSSGGGARVAATLPPAGGSGFVHARPRQTLDCRQPPRTGAQTPWLWVISAPTTPQSSSYDKDGLEGVFREQGWGRCSGARRERRPRRARRHAPGARTGAHRAPSPWGAVPRGGWGRGNSPRQSWAMSSSSLAVCPSPISASAVMDAQAALSSSCFAMSRGGGLSSSPSISSAWYMNSSDNVLMRENASLISVGRYSIRSSVASAVGEATTGRGKVGISVMGGCSRGCAAGFVRQSWRPDARNIRPPHFTPHARGNTWRYRWAGCSPPHESARGGAE